VHNNSYYHAQPHPIIVCTTELHKGFISRFFLSASSVLPRFSMIVNLPELNLSGEISCLMNRCMMIYIIENKKPFCDEVRNFVEKGINKACATGFVT
jgi:hypothetical protein